ncbi:MAG: hypothetical protein ACRC57_03895 [Sarcina sp.]
MKMNKMIKKRLIELLIFIPIPIISIILIFLTMNGSIFGTLEHRSLHKLVENIGFYGVFIFIVPAALFVFRLLIKYTAPKGVNDLQSFLSSFNVKISNNVKNKFLDYKYLPDIRKLFSLLGKFFQKLHIPICLIAISVIGYHIYLAFHMGWIWSIGYITGFIAAIFLLLITITGITRIFNKNIKTHKYLIFGLGIFTVLHVLTIK